MPQYGHTHLGYAIALALGLPTIPKIRLYQFWVQPDFLGDFYLPEEMTRAEIERLGRVIATGILPCD